MIIYDGMCCVFGSVSPCCPVDLNQCLLFAYSNVFGVFRNTADREAEISLVDLLRETLTKDGR